MRPKSALISPVRRKGRGSKLPNNLSTYFMGALLSKSSFRSDGSMSDLIDGLSVNARRVLFLASYCSRTVLTWWDYPCVKSLACDDLQFRPR